MNNFFVNLEGLLQTRQQKEGIALKNFLQAQAELQKQNYRLNELVKKLEQIKNLVSNRLNTQNSTQLNHMAGHWKQLLKEVVKQQVMLQKAQENFEGKKSFLVHTIRKRKMIESLKDKQETRPIRSS